MTKLKLQNEYETVENALKKEVERIKKYARELNESGDYNDFERRLTFDCLRAFIGVKTMCEWHDKYGCNDNHIYTLGRSVLRKLGVI